MPDVLIRNFPAEDLALLDEHAARLGISRTEHLRRQLQQVARRTVTAVTAADLVAFAQSIPDLADDDVMTDAWS
ncbi:MAG: ribbon-helix-helix protein, CopG family [Nocardioidaceae bacterium]|nr:ribbon-helix-helix protein, CopG family [Nocardioidaceae bacterium]